MEKDDEARVRLAKDAPRADEGARDAEAPAGAAGTGAPDLPDAAGADPAAGATALEPDGGEGPGEALVSGAAYAALGILGGVFGVVGSFVQDWTIGPVPLAALVLVGLVFAMAWLSGKGMGGRLGATVPALAWGVVVFVLSLRRPEGDLIVPGTLAGSVFIIGGMVAAVIGIMLVPPARPPGDWLLGRAGRVRG
ncbi:DUF6113 family protein [Actinomadura sp. WMMA1423]|uniref:DUF6113 family protein n=1 Tax=Actinomadura sp. WMMA1423 TaxID=2591108 RepID=UPI001146876F|nr:DUF6113 family protein [Actinomadura sp. WMMA1423]